MNIYEEMGLKRVINASGRMTKLGVSTFSDGVAKATSSGGQSFVVIDDLYLKAGEIISKYTGAKASCVTNSASAAIALSVAGLITKGNDTLTKNIPNSEGLANEIIIAKGHMIDYGAPMETMLNLGGGKILEAGAVNLCTISDFENLINEKTVGLFFVQSHHTVQKGMVDLESLIKLAHKYSLPVIVDAASEEDLKKYISMGCDLVIYSGAKALQATTSGFVTGEKDLIEYIQKQNVGIGRAMKIGKESIMGLLKALEEYEKKDKVKEIMKNVEMVNKLVKELNAVNGLKTKKVKDATREIYRAEVEVISDKIDAKKVMSLLNSGNPSIHVRKHRANEGYLTIDTRSTTNQDIELIIKRFKEIMEVNK